MGRLLIIGCGGVAELRFIMLSEQQNVFRDLLRKQNKVKM